MEKAPAFTQELRDQPNCTPINPGPRHWDIFSRLCRTGGIKGQQTDKDITARDHHAMSRLFGGSVAS
ncbi:hypothetical protein COMA2_150009 [Candidatus Nitrospira nitrificans]|uniref:Uncharacterized protein n=1 Tax=Candidatus Nitrospira nitrificans TaxID=1742973 RepID=A0A0S4L893_9BACT|nr:hypothetical protein COMA2_150009 [Candidatus Nitrospira nitrificans]